MTPAQPDAAADPLDGVTVAVPCTVPWESMRGDERRRFCGQCRLHVHDLSAMTREEAIEILDRRAAGESVCVRFYRRPDGRVLTRDCRRAVAEIRRRAALAVAAVLGAVGLSAFAWTRARTVSWDDPGLWSRQPFATIAKVLPAAWRASPPRPTMGEICPSPPVMGR